MPQHDNEPLSDIPQMVPDRDELASYQRQKQGKPKPSKEPEDDDGEVESGGGSNVLVYLVGVIAVAAVAAAGYLFVQLQGAEERVAALEQKLSSTDESVNQSSTALQVKINEVDAALNLLRDETLKKYKAQLDQQGVQIAALDKSGKSAQAALAASDKSIGEQAKSIDGLRGEIAKMPGLLDPTKQKVEQHQAALDALAAKQKTLGEAQVKLDARLSNNEEWVESINTFRKQMNREVVNIKQQIAGGKPMPAPDAIQ